MKQRVLIVEDEVIIGLATKLRLEGFNPNIEGECVCSCEEAIERAKDADLMIIDIRLGGNMNGIEASKIIYEKFATPHIYVTGYDDREIREAAKESNPLAYFVKPFGKKEICQFLDGFFKDLGREER